MGQTTAVNHAGGKIVTSVVVVFLIAAAFRTIVYNWLVGSNLIAGQLATLILAFILGYFLLHGRTWARVLTVAFSIMTGALSGSSVVRSTSPLETVAWILMVGFSAYVVVALVLPHSVNMFFGASTDADSSRG